MFRSATLSAAAKLERNVRRSESQFRARWRHINWALLLGSLIVLGVFILAIWGPQLALQDPLAQSAIFKVGNNWKRPPLPAFTVPGYPLGTDWLGRDLLSWLLWAVRPTMIMVAVVAVVRLFLGTMIGLAAGWFVGRTGRVLDLAITGALSVPILMVALAAIAAVGAEIGLPAFLIGLSITGWAETARVVREQTRVIKGQLYIEAARALGQSDLRILVYHVGRQVLPMVWMLFALEVSATLMVTAGLGFMGYYVGGDVWIEISDFVSTRTSGTPELGQMLASARAGLAGLARGGPWAMVSVGTTVFIVILGFNLLGQGLRHQLSMERMGRRTIVAKMIGRLRMWFTERVFQPAAHWVRGKERRIGLAGLAVLVVGGGLLGWRLLARAGNKAPEGAAVILTVPGGQLWASGERDPYGTRYVEKGQLKSPHILWTLNDRSGFSGGPAVAADGTIYLASTRGTLYALSPDGQVLWSATMPTITVGAPALDKAGNIYLVEKWGGLSSFTPAGKPLWRFVPKQPGEAPFGPTIGLDGMIYYVLGGSVAAVRPDGTVQWEVLPPTGYRVIPPRLSPDGQLLFWQDIALDTRDGSAVDLKLPTKVTQYLVGADGRTYLRTTNNVAQWRRTAAGAEIVRSAAWDSRAIATETTTRDAGVTPQGIIWLYFSLWGDRVVWLDSTGRVLGYVQFEWWSDQLVGIDGEATAYACGAEGNNGLCAAFSRESEAPLWEVPLDSGATVAGGALVPGRLYVAMAEGFFYALGDGKAAAGTRVAVSSPTPAPSPTPTAPGLVADLTTSERCWVQITADGNVVYAGTLPAGTTRTFTATQELRLHMGNAGAVRVSLNGQDLGVQGEPGQVVEQVWGKELPSVPTVSPTAAPAATSSPTVSLTAAPTSPSAPPSTSSAPVGLEVTLVVSETSWAQVTADGSTVFEGTLSAGTTRTFTATQELRLRLGNAGGVYVSLNGQDLGVQGQPGQVVEKVWQKDLVPPMPTSTPTPIPAPAPTLIPTGMEATLVIIQPCWVQFIADGTKVFEGILLPEASRTFTAVHEMRLRIVNAGGVRVILNGVDLGVQGGTGQFVQRVWRK